MSVTQMQLANDIKEAISYPLEEVFGGPVHIDPMLKLSVNRFGETLADAIAKAIAKAVDEGVVG